MAEAVCQIVPHKGMCKQIYLIFFSEMHSELILSKSRIVAWQACIMSIIGTTLFTNVIRCTQ